MEVQAPEYAWPTWGGSISTVKFCLLEEVAKLAFTTMMISRDWQRIMLLDRHYYVNTATAIRLIMWK